MPTNGDHLFTQKQPPTKKLIVYLIDREYLRVLSVQMIYAHKHFQLTYFTQKLLHLRTLSTRGT